MALQNFNSSHGHSSNPWTQTMTAESARPNFTNFYSKAATTGLSTTLASSKNWIATATAAWIFPKYSPSTTSSRQGTSCAEGIEFTSAACILIVLLALILDLIIKQHMIYVPPAIAIVISITTIHTSWITMYCYAPNEAFLLVLH
ncbi:hypothetical protein C1H46_004777 [Malus baccata]|uniref:Uncharacterized protein n=1 Tax=Malus baccata TaxID=106549 RepID=A0A540NEW1_MALBA|nr:hypothetical protein C1H46_004777 [Malus baccata]